MKRIINNTLIKISVIAVAILGIGGSTLQAVGTKVPLSTSCMVKLDHYTCGVAVGTLLYSTAIAGGVTKERTVTGAPPGGNTTCKWFGFDIHSNRLTFGPTEARNCNQATTIRFINALGTVFSVHAGVANNTPWTRNTCVGSCDPRIL